MFLLAARTGVLAMTHLTGQPPLSPEPQEVAQAQKKMIKILSRTRGKRLRFENALSNDGKAKKFRGFVMICMHMSVTRAPFPPQRNR